MAPLTRKSKDLLSLIAIASLFSGGRLFVGAISVLYVLSHSITLAEFASLKSLQVITFLLFDIPLGFFIKRFGYKKSLLVTFILSISGLFLYVIGNTLLTFYLAEFFLALSLCLCPTSFTEYTMSIIKKYPSLQVEQVFHRQEMYVNSANLFCGGFGGVLFTLSGVYPYCAGILFQLIGLALILNIEEGESCEEVKEKDGTINIKLIPLIILLFAIQLTIQPLYHYWQPLFYEIDPQVSGDFLGGVFVSYSFCAIIFNYLFSKEWPFFRSINCLFTLLFAAVFFYFVTALTQNIFVIYLSFSLLQGLFYTSLTSLSAFLSRLIEPHNRPVTLKLISFLSRLGMLLSFFCIQVVAPLKVQNLYLLSACVLFISIVFVKLIQIKIYKKDVENGTNVGYAKLSPDEGLSD